MKQHREATGGKLKAALKEARRDRKQAIKSVFTQFKTLLYQTARSQWESIVKGVCVKADKDPPPPPELNMTNLGKCLRELRLTSSSKMRVRNSKSTSCSTYACPGR